MSLIWTKEGSYWKIVAIRLEDSSDAGFTPVKTAAAPAVSEPEPRKIGGDPNAVKDITDFYQSWIGNGILPGRRAMRPKARTRAWPLRWKRRKR
jgi:hypothetical protein